MPRYASSLAKSLPFSASVLLNGGRRIQKALEYMHSKGFVHMDVKADNIFIDANGLWFLGDFGSAVKIGQNVTSTTEWFTAGNWIGKAAKIEFDWFMLAVTMVCESNRDSWKDFLIVKDRNHTTLQKLQSAVQNKLPDPHIKAFVEGLLVLCQSFAYKN